MKLLIYTSNIFLSTHNHQETFLTMLKYVSVSCLLFQLFMGKNPGELGEKYKGSKVE